MPKEMTKATEPKPPQAKPRSKASAKAKVPAKSATKSVTKTAAKPVKQTDAKPRAATPRKPGPAAASARSKAPSKAKPKTQTPVPSRAVTVPTPVDNVLVGAAVRSLQASVPAAIAMNTKLADMAHANMSAGIELARGLASAKTPMDAMRLGVSYWFSHMSTVQTQARELQGLSAAWVKTASQQGRNV